MKYIYSLLLFCLCNSLFSQDTCKWLQDEAEWSYTPWTFNPGSTEILSKIEIVGDTTIGNRVCSILARMDDGELIEESRLITFYENSSQHVFFYEDEEFKIIYDFSHSVQAGDTLEFYLPQNFGYLDISSSSSLTISEPPSKVAYKLRYLISEQVNLGNGEWLRITPTVPLSNDNGECFSMRDIIAGIGSSNGLVGQSCSQLLGGRPEFFRCFKSNTLEYSETDCLITSVYDLENIDIVVHPNPTTDRIHFTTDHDFSLVEIINPQGSLVNSQKYADEISINDLPAGYYIIVLTDTDGGRYTSSIVKE